MVLPRPMRSGSFRGQSRWRSGRVVEGSGLENRQGCKPLEGSNPSLSAIRAVPGTGRCEVPRGRARGIFRVPERWPSG